MDVKNLETNLNIEENNNLINNNKEISFDKGNFTEDEHRTFLESFILSDKNFKEMEQYNKTKNYNDILIYSDKFITYLNKKYNKKENSLNLKIDKENINNYPNEKLEEYIYEKFCLPIKNSFKENSNSVDDFFVDDNKSLLGLSKNNKKIFFIRKYPKYKTLLNNNLNIENKNNISGIQIPNIGNDKESRKKLINKLLNENCKEANYTKMEELAKMSEILQIINKVENYNITNDESVNSKSKSFVTNDSNLNKNNNSHNKINENKLGRKRLNQINEKNEKELENLNDIKKLNDSNNQNINNNNNILNNNNYFKNLFLSSQQNNILNQQQNNTITNQNINNPYYYNQINFNNCFPYMNGNINKIPNYSNFGNQQLMPPPIFNLPIPMVGFNMSNINQPMTFEHNNQNPYFDNVNFLINQQQQNINLMNSINYFNNLSKENQSMPLFGQNQQMTFNNQNKEINNINFQNLSNFNNVNFQNNLFNLNNIH